MPDDARRWQYDPILGWHKHGPAPEPDDARFHDDATDVAGSGARSNESGAGVDARVSSLAVGEISDALDRAIKALTVTGRSHVGYAHPIGSPFAYRPLVCPGCAHAVLVALRQKEVLYV